MEENVRVIDRAFDILEVLAASNTPMGLSEICRATGMSKSTVYRLISNDAQSTLCRKKSG